MDKLSVIVPCYNEEKAILLFYKEFCKIYSCMKDVEFQVIFIDDGSSDNTLNEIKKIADGDECCSYISFSRNFGKEAALYAGLNKASGNYIAMMDVDLQDPPILLQEMFYFIKVKRYDAVVARRVNRKGEPIIRSCFARQFYKIIRRISKNNIVDGARDFRMITRQVAEAVLGMNEFNRFSKEMFSWVGFKTKWIEYENKNRIIGESKWSFIKLFTYAINGIMAFSTIPLSIATIAGSLFIVVSMIMICIFIIKILFFSQKVGELSLLILAMFFIGGIQLFCTGIVGQYLAKVYVETKKRPIYIIKEEV
ncbi:MULTISPECIES: glycosyltransferase family 2 protein [Clostridia]|uniref:Glycosyltransferase family 2 protein n=2 Tax=Clostridia TaxID=186801 RepID=A0A8I0AC73_9CLOT|nr:MULTISPECIES: glycosyltransferase family 2 protein [Clostridia]MBC5639035.1 glycosyltransferase family 2 protein [Clostridium lentum]MBC5653128.1 glycosyltransferase family 2 protein [Blautia lenta]OKZ88967.1 MAG: glycosyltransferase [Clostridium sp. 29_15]